METSAANDPMVFTITEKTPGPDMASWFLLVLSDLRHYIFKTLYKTLC